MVPHRMIPLLLALFLSCTHYRPTWSFATKTSDLVAMRRKALSKAKATSPSKNLKNNVQQQTTNNQHEQRSSKSFILEVLDEALFRQQSAIEALDREVERKKMEEMDDNQLATLNTVCNSDELELETATAELESREKTTNDFSRVKARRNELCDIDLRLQDLRSTIRQTKGQTAQNNLQLIKQKITDLGYGSIFSQPQSSWKSTKARCNEFGRPLGFDGDIFYSHLGVPILVGRMRAHKDEVMRNAAQGSDLWFQVEDYNGARVLLRTSLMRGTAGSKHCRQMAADLAAKYSVWGEEYESIPVMYTDSRKVAKRGSRIGNMKKSKSLGRIMGYPQNI
mmetsp:Transcript_13687/g.29807  ORF Transcript_13687/g.29807 Transcript_13687/m.29807 type:complete len:337 (-) Transcript_13687:1032-2042(-)